MTDILTNGKRFDTLDLALTKVIREVDLYNGEIHMVFNPNAKGSQPRYTANGEITPGVTSVLGVLNKELLKQWAANKASEYWLDNYAQIGSNTTAPKLYEDARKAYLKHAEKAADLGSLVHYGTECYDHDGTILKFTDNRANEMLDRYIAWRLETEWEVVDIERLVYSRQYRFAGTLDRVFRTPAGLIIIDVKTSKVSAFNQKGVNDEYGLQLGAYAIALEEELGERVVAVGLVNPDKEWGEFHVHMLDDEAYANGKEAFIATVTLWRLFNQAKYHNKKQNTLKPAHWYALHSKATHNNTNGEAHAVHTNRLRSKRTRLTRKP